MLIRLYGQFWNPDAVQWGGKGAGNKGQLLGKVTTDSDKKKILDFWEARGVYTLYEDFRLVYVGQSLTGKDGCLGKRLRDHLTDRFAGRWDMFSWFSMSSLRENTLRNPGTRQITPINVVSTLEAFGIAIASPPLNRRYNQFPGAREVEQAKSPHPQTVRHYLERILNQLEPSKTSKTFGKKK